MTAAHGCTWNKDEQSSVRVELCQLDSSHEHEKEEEWRCKWRWDISVSILPKNFYVAERLRKARPKVFVKILTHSKSDKSARFLKTSFVQLHAIMGLQSGKGARTSETTSVGAVMDSIELP